MKKLFGIIATAVVIINIAMLSFNAARSDEISISGIRQVNNVKMLNQINTLAKPDEYSYVAVALTSTVTVGGSGYKYILWTQQSVTSAQAKKIIAYIADNTTGRLGKITVDNTLVVSGNPYEWAASQNGKSLTFSRYTLRQSDNSIMSGYAYGLYRETASVTSATTAESTVAATTLEATTTRPQLTVVTHTTVPEHGATSAVTTEGAQTPLLPTIPRTTVPEHGATSAVTTEGAQTPVLPTIPRTTVPEHGATSAATTEGAQTPLLPTIPRTTVPEHGATSAATTEGAQTPVLPTIPRTTVPEHGATSAPSTSPTTQSPVNSTKPADPPVSERIPQLGG